MEAFPIRNDDDYSKALRMLAPLLGHETEMGIPLNEFYRNMLREIENYETREFLLNNRNG